MATQLKNTNQGEPSAKVASKGAIGSKLLFLFVFFFVTFVMVYIGFVLASVFVPSMKEFLNFSFFSSFWMEAVVPAAISTAIVCFLILPANRVRSIYYVLTVCWSILMLVASFGYHCYLFVM